MAKKTQSGKIKCQRYFNEKRRIKNKKRKLEKRLKKMTKENSKKNVIAACPIGRKKEGFNRLQNKKKKKSD